jgi:membrane-associated phospholipid phosphatase
LSLSIPKGDDVLLINGNHSPFLDWLFSWLTNLGDGVIFVPIIIGFLFISFGSSLMGVSVCALLSILSVIFKQFLFPNAGRPKTFLNPELLHFVSGINVHSLHSFPSGHTATIFAAAVLVSLISSNRILSILLLMAALLVGYSRIYLLQHFLLDVAAGAAMGSITAFIVYYVSCYLKAPAWSSSRIEIKVSLRGNIRQPSSRI